jgi:Mg-chelatase subunit ChlD/type II secretory pathway pseudopilin PulG
MNPDKPSRDEIEVKLTALLLGELPDEEARLLRWTISQDAALKNLHDELAATIVLVREAEKNPAAPGGKEIPLKLSDERREKLLAHFQTPRRPAAKELFWLKRIEVPQLVTVLAVVAIMAVLAAMLLPALASAKRKAQHVSALAEARQKAMEAQMPAEENSPAAAPASAEVAQAPVATTLPPEPVLAPPPAQIVLPQTGLPPEAATETGPTTVSGTGGVYSQNVVGYVNPGAGAIQLPPPAALPASPPMPGSLPPDGIAEDQRLPGASSASAGVLAQDGKTLYEQGRFDESEAKLGQALKLNSDSVDVQYYLNLDKQAELARAENSHAMDTQARTAQVEKEWPQPALAWDDSGAYRAQLKNQAADDGWKDRRSGSTDTIGGTFKFQAGNDSLPPDAALPEGKFPGAAGNELASDGSGFTGKIETAPSQVGSEEKFYRKIGSANDTDKVPEPGDAPVMGKLQASTEFADNAPVVTASPAPVRNRFISRNIYLGAPMDLADAAKVQPQSNAGALVLNGVNESAGATTVSGGSLLLGVSKAENNKMVEPPADSFSSAQVQVTNAIVLAGGNTFNPATSAIALDSVSSADSEQQKLAKEDVNGLRMMPAPPVSSAPLQSQSRQQANQLEDDSVVPKKSLPAPISQPEVLTSENAFSTFSMNVSDVSFKLAAASLENGRLPDAASIRSEEFINAFDYRDPEAAAGQPVAFASERARDPFAQNRDLLRFSIKTAALGRAAGRPLNLVLLLDNSGSMERADRVAIIREALRVLATQLHPQDTVSVVTFARTARLWVDGVAGDKAGEVFDQVGGLTPQGGTNLEEAMRLAYETARRHYLANGVNRVVLLTDGAANLGNVDGAALKEKVEAQRRQGIALDCFGIGWEDYNDDLLAELSGNGDGRYAFLNSPEDVANEFAAKLAGALQVAAEDVKVQVEFNPQRVIAWRQIGYAQHQLTKEQFRDNSVLAAEIAAQEAGNALYTVQTKPDGDGPLATVRVRYKIPGTTVVQEHEWEVPYAGNAVSLEQSSAAMRLAATAGAFSEWLAASPFAQEVSPDELLQTISGVPEIYGADQRPKKLEWMIRQAKSLSGK